MATYYVKTGGNDSLDGLSDATAWETVEKVTATTFAAGSVICFRKGDTFVGFLSPPAGGASGNPTIYTSYGTADAKPIIQGNSASIAAALYINTRNYITVSGIRFESTSFTAASIAATFAALTGVAIDDCEFYVTGTGADRRCLQVTCASTAGRDITNLSITNCLFSNLVTSSSSTVGINIYTATSGIYDIAIEGNTFRDIQGNAIRCIAATPGTSVYPYGITINNNLFEDIDYSAINWIAGTTTTSSSYITNNACNRIGDPAVSNINAFQLSRCRNVVVSDNIIDTVQTSLPDGCGIILDFAAPDTSHVSIGCIVERNTISNCYTGIAVYYAQDCVVRNNICFDNSVSGISLAHATSTGNVFYHNVCDGNANGIAINQRDSEVAPLAVITNNILTNNTSYGLFVHSTATAPTETYNAFFGNTYNKASGTTAPIAIGTGSITSDPLFTSESDYRLLSGSPCIDAGTTIGGMTMDFDLNEYPGPNGTSIGPYQDYSAPKEGFSPWVHFDGTIQAWEE